MMKYLLLLILVYSLQGGTYDDNYNTEAKQDSSKSKLDSFMYGEFKEIVRFDMIHFDDSEMQKDLLKERNITNYDNMIERVKEYVNRGEDIRVKIIGHTKLSTDDENELRVASKTYADSIISWFEDSLDSNTSKTVSRDYAKFVQDELLANEIDENITIVEYRSGFDMAYSDSDSDATDLSNRVMVTIYVLNQAYVDSDGDGVFDKDDRCPKTPSEVTVDIFGCPLDSDKDMVLDYKDRCPKTPLHLKVDEVGCSADSDSDGVVDYKDLCPDTALGVVVDINGCPKSQELAINFKRKSDEIAEGYHPKIVEFSTFLQKNLAYTIEIVGHADSTGKDADNMDLSQRRAASVKSAIIAEGVDASRVKSTGRGELEPIKTNETKAGRKANRRIEMKLFFNNEI